MSIPGVHQYHVHLYIRRKNRHKPSLKAQDVAIFEPNKGIARHGLALKLADAFFSICEDPSGGEDAKLTDDEP
ncbi:unnamed protein product [Penicillium roqueforti FM164]|uniref:Genomic scaffold, ProqFM164S01 n=1 Tax=Penicillium roqueforti (strain FM164) TaxID=1365484 RepID=W6Q8Z0_PENRF|nr:unnamed protein product [Penicillium roqueforti FM164]